MSTWELLHYYWNGTFKPLFIAGTIVIILGYVIALLSQCQTGVVCATSPYMAVGPLMIVAGIVLIVLSVPRPHHRPPT